jgi:hypothetical protein
VVDGPSPERLRTIALNRLKELGIQAWVSDDGWARGRLLVRPERFHPYPGVDIGRDQTFAVYQHAFLGFAPPSPLAHLGGIRFYEERSQDSLHLSLEQRWRSLLEGTEGALRRARAFRPNARLDLSSWNIESSARDRFGELILRFDGRLTVLYVYSVDGKVLDYTKGDQPIAMALPHDVMTLDEMAIAPLVQMGRGRVGAPADDHRPIELMLESVDMVSVQQDGSIRSTLDLPASDDLSFDLDRLKTGDLPVWEGRSAQAPKEPAGRAMQRKHPRVREEVLALMSWEGGRADVMVADVSAGGAFVQAAPWDLPKQGTLVRLSGFGKVSVQARVAHVRPEEEAELFSTGGGAGLEFVPPARRFRFDAPAIAILLRDPAARTRAILAVDQAGGVPIVVEHLAALAALLVEVEVALVVMGSDFEEGVPALGLDGDSVGALLVRPGSEGRLDAAAIRSHLAV